MCWRRPGWSALSALTLASAALVAAPACEDDTPVQRGFGSRQIAQLRETEFRFDGARGDIVLYSIGRTPAESRYFSIDLTTGAVREHDDPFYEDVPAPTFYVSSADPDRRFRCLYGAGPTGESQYWIDDTQTGERTVIENPGFIGGCPTESDPTLELWRRDEDGTYTFWTGPYDAVQMVPIDLRVVHISAQSYRSTDAFVQVLAARPTAPDALGVFLIDMASFAVTELVSPGLQGGAWADGATPTPTGALDSASLFMNSEFGAGVAPVGDHFRYYRSMTGGGETMFVGPFASGSRELALFQRDESDPATVSIARTPAACVTIPPVWQRVSADGPLEFLIWDDGRRRLVTCPWGLVAEAGLGAASLDGSKLALFLRRTLYGDVDGYGETGPLLLVDLTDPGAGSAPCRTLAPDKISVAGFSPDGTALFWLVEPKDQYSNGELWLAASDGSAPRLVGTDNIPGPPYGPRFVGPSQLQLQIDTDLVWLDTHDDPIQTHAIVEHVLGEPIDRGRWLIVGYDASDQDGTARLGVVNRDDGTNKRLISPDVSDYMTPDISAYDGPGYRVIPGPRAAGDPIRIVYLVRGRNPSAQDGLWVATINASDIP